MKSYSKEGSGGQVDAPVAKGGKGIPSGMPGRVEIGSGVDTPGRKGARGTEPMSGKKGGGKGFKATMD